MFLSSCLKAEETHLITPLNLHSLQLSPQETSRFTFNDTPKYTTYKSINQYMQLCTYTPYHTFTLDTTTVVVSPLSTGHCVGHLSPKPSKNQADSASNPAAPRARARARVASRRAHKTQQRLAATARALLAHL